MGLLKGYELGSKTCLVCCESGEAVSGEGEGVMRGWVDDGAVKRRVSRQVSPEVPWSPTTQTERAHPPCLLGAANGPGTVRLEAPRGASLLRLAEVLLGRRPFGCSSSQEGEGAESWRRPWVAELQGSEAGTPAGPLAGC